MLQRCKLILIFSSVFIIYAFAAKINDDISVPHPFINSDNYCINCHTNKNIKVLINNPAEACSTQCLTCHKDMSNHHTIDLKINENLPKGFILTSKKRITCITCHKLNSKRYDSSSWKAESMYEKIFNSKDLYKTFYLVKKNNDGQLCKICH